MRGAQVIYACPSEECRFHAMEPGKCRSHPYPLRAMGPELIPVFVEPTEPDKVEAAAKAALERHEESRRPAGPSAERSP